MDKRRYQCRRGGFPCREGSVRSFNCLKRAGINTVEDLINKSEEDMMKVRNLGRKSLEEVVQKLNSLGFSLQKEDE